MKAKKILAVLLSGVIALSTMSANAATCFAVSSKSEQVSVARVWDGTYDIDWFTNDKNSYDIYTAEELAGLSYLCDNKMHEDRFRGVTINLMNDIVLNDTSNFENWDTKPPKNLWKPIGDVGDFFVSGYRPFAGTFNGNGHTISGMYTNSESRNILTGPNGLTGLFECTCGAQIKNLRFEKCHSKSNKTAGILAGCNQGTIVKCVEIDNCRVIAPNNAGGMAGCADRFILSEEMSVLTYFAGMAVTGMAINPLIFGGAFLGKDDPTTTYYYACKVSDTKITGENTGGLAGYAGVPTAVAYCLIENNVFEGNSAAAIVYPQEEEGHYVVIDSYSHNNKDGSGKKAALNDSKLVKNVKRSSLLKSSFVKKLNKKFFAYDKGNSPRLISLIDTPIDVALHGKKATISWEKVDNAVKYKVYCKNSSGKYKLLATTKNLTTVLKNIKKGKEYSILIRAYFKGGKYETAPGGKFSFKA